MHSKDTIVNDGCKAHVVKEFTTVPPYIGISKLADTLVIEPVNLCDLAAFMVSTDQSYPIRISHLQNINANFYIFVYFEGEEEEEGLDTVETTVHKVTQEQVVSGRTFPTHFEQFLQVPELSMDIPTNLPNL